MAELVPKAEKFATILSEVVNGTVGRDVRFVVTPLVGPVELAWVFAEGSTPTKVLPIAIVCGMPPGSPVLLWLRTWFLVRLDDPRKHLAVERSAFALEIGEQNKRRPALRVEFDRDKGNEPDDLVAGKHRRSAAHVQIHGTSHELAYVQGINRVLKIG